MPVVRQGGVVGTTARGIPMMTAAGSSGCSGACGGAEVLCCEAEGAVTSVNWVFVGEGQGAYDPAQQFNFVGEGMGEYQQEEVTTYYGWKVRPVWYGIMLVLLLGLIVFFVFGPSPSLPTTTVAPLPQTLPPTAPPFPMPTFPPMPPPPPMPTTPAPFDCNEGGVDIWTIEKKSWCCLHYKNGCPTLVPPPTQPALPFDCAAGFENWMAGWAIDKKAWCCLHVGKGCPPAGGCETTMLPYDCAAGFENWAAGWSLGKKAWCCQHTGKGCATVKACPQSG